MTEKLFIIGNGFDLAHGIKSSYSAFKDFLKNSIPPFYKYQDLLSYPGLIKNKDDLYSFLIQAIDKVEGNQWSTLEESLSKLKFNQSFKMVTKFKALGDMNPVWLKSNIEESISDGLLSSTIYIQTAFGEWIKTIDTNISLNKNIQHLLSGNSAFLSFNYTDTLEKVYTISDVCHIHGKANEKIYFGHGKSSEIIAASHSEYNGAFNNLTDLGEELRKKTEDALKNNADFFNRISNYTKEIYSFGFSYGEVDLVYIKAICEKLSEDSVWHLNKFDKEKNVIFIEKMEECGYKGTFNTY